MSVEGRLARLERQCRALLTDRGKFEERLEEFERSLEDAITTGRWGPGLPFPEDLSRSFRWLLDHDPEMPPYMKGWRDEDLQVFLQAAGDIAQEEEGQDPWQAVLSMVREQVAQWKGEGAGEL